ncbi:TraM recognition domain-containing protein [Nocardioides sp. InS609-2]|uniref:type IV secretory system conjugative DNA transfer family protein n=1 Tax=Nocardioides sp. InS609-2 TaxID=2760705 RepID=UPI0020BF9D28|nr:TraM recognition domain-containing protein [Nocardioides sp. InS609-2]
MYLWLTDPNDDEPPRLLDDAGYPLQAASVRGVVGSPDKQRAGVYGTAQQTASFLTNSRATQWVTPPAAGTPAEFRPEEFARGTGTLYSLSKEGRGNTAPLVTALTVAVCEAAEEYAATQPGGRLAVPMVTVLDEAANVCRWTELPNLYSHYGSRGIAILTFLQSWSQGVEVWGRDGMRKLWSAATVKVYGGGVSEVEFLDELSRLIGDYQRPEASITHSRGNGRSTSHSQRSERILDVADLAGLDRGRVVVFAAGSLPTLATPQPWWEGPHKTAVQASIDAHDAAASGDRP